MTAGIADYVENNMTNDDLATRYNYDEFTAEKVFPWMAFDDSPPVGRQAPDFPLWQLEDQGETSLSEIWKRHSFTLLEFGSFT